ncbi:hypothetical protein V5O48_011688 [Marasmius crinis-equi]|uniref:Endonuclease n=1 Tax=Marasmius crinis-equi TaxID=585013 RepID=A0ABR3F4Z1_9AGAR
MDSLARRALSVPLPTCLPLFKSNMEVYSYYTLYRDEWRARLAALQDILNRDTRTGIDNVDTGVQALSKVLKLEEFPTHSTYNLIKRTVEAFPQKYRITDYRGSWLREIETAIDNLPRWSKFQSDHSAREGWLEV